MANNRKTISNKLTHLVLFSFLFSVMVFLVVHVGLNRLLNEYFNSNSYINSQKDAVIQNLKQYVREQHVSATDKEKLIKWTTREKYVMITIFRDGLLIYDSAYTASEEKGYYSEKQRLYEKENSCEVVFSDGKADVLVYEMYVQKYYEMIFVAEFVGACVLILMMVLYGVKLKIKDIELLNDEIHIMEGGELDYPVTVRGNDELTQLAESVDGLRQSFREKLVLIETLQQDRRNMVTEMAHDMRTPLTALLMYLGFAEDERNNDAQSVKLYVNKAYDQAQYLKAFSDKLFDYFLIDSTMDMELELVSFSDAFYDGISDFVSHLRSNGYIVNENLDFPALSVQINKEYVARILYNCMSNIVKYSCKDEEIALYCVERNNAVEIRIVNSVKETIDINTESTMMGIRIIEKMMGKMFGKYITKRDGLVFESVLIFPIVEK